MGTILIAKNVMVPMRDGVRLATDVYRLEGAAPAPVHLARTPYDKEEALLAAFRSTSCARVRPATSS